MRRAILASLCTAALALPCAAGAGASVGSGTGGAAPPGASTSREGGGAAYGDPIAPAPRRTSSATAPRRSAGDGRPVLRSFDVSPGRFFLYGTPARLSFRIDDRSPTVAVQLVVTPVDGSKAIRAIALGQRKTGVNQSYSFSGLEGGLLPQGPFTLRLRARDPQRHRLSAGARSSAVEGVGFYWHRFPISGPFSYSGPDGQFGAARPGHSHQGQDLSAAEGTAVVAPRGGRITNVRFQAEGAGHYVVLDGQGEDRDYVFMHLQTGSIVVAEGQRVRTGQRIGSVGNTGRSFGAHLHFEVWEGGGWFTGGHAIDPLPYLKRWDSWS